MSGNSLLLDTCVIVKHFRDATAVADKLAAYDDLYLPQQALGELYYGAYRSARPEKHLDKIERFLEAVDVLNPTKKFPCVTAKSPPRSPRPEPPFPKMTSG